MKLIGPERTSKDNDRRTKPKANSRSKTLRKNLLHYVWDKGSSFNQES